MWGCNLSYCYACCISWLTRPVSVKWTMYSHWKQNIVTCLSLHYFESFKWVKKLSDKWVAFIISHGSLFVQPQLPSQLFSCAWNGGLNTLSTNFESLSACGPTQLHNSVSPFPCSLYSKLYKIVVSYIVEKFKIPIINTTCPAGLVIACLLNR